VIPIAFDYRRATSVEDALAQLAGSAGAKLIAGGHSLVPLMKLRLSEPSVLVDIARIPGLSGIREAGGGIEIGACTTHYQVASSALLVERCPLLAEAAGSIGDPQVRNRGTLGGSLAHADPSADYPAAMLALDATVQVQGPKGTRGVAARDFFQGVFTVDLAADEIIVAVRFTPVRTGAYARLRQRASHFAIVGVAAALDVSGGVIKGARVAVTGAGPSATRLTAVEEALAGKPANAATAADAAARATLDEVNADLHGSEEYRRAMTKVFTRRALEGALARI
jgi:aerobic carbon-monoxide dehydrogenase medium subunit